MRIIDKITDYYDYLQDSTDKLVFDRRGSFLLTREILCVKIRFTRYYWESKYRFVLLQCGATFWLFLVTITAWDAEHRPKDNILWYKEHRPTDYTMELLATWKDYDKKRELLKLDLINVHRIYDMRVRKTREFDHEKILARVSYIKNEIIHNNYDVETNISSYTKVTSSKGGFVEEEQRIPILRACGVGSIIEPIEMFCAIEEYFSLEETASERAEAIGATNDDKIIMHGFDTKTSFRGK